MPLSPTQLTLKALRDEDWLPWVTETWNSFARIRQDLFGVIDILALKGPTTRAIQCTSDSNVSARVRKIADCENTPAMRAAGWQIEVWGWRRLKGEWVCRIVDCS